MKFELYADNSGNNDQSNRIILPDTSARFLSALYGLSKKHDIDHLVGDALIKNGLIENGDIKSKFQNEIFMAVYRYEQLTFSLNQICNVLEEAKIPFIPLKGSVIRQYYPEPWMRTSCDVDILVHEKDLEKVSSLLTEKLSYQEDGKGSHDITFYTPSGMHIELHYDLIEKNINVKSEQPLHNVWGYTYAKPNSTHYYMVDEMFYYYHVAHMAKHFVIGGCGVRPFIDIWVLNHRIPYNSEKRKQLLIDGGLFLFERASVRLSEVWFSGAELDETTKLMQDYILQGGVYGNVANRVAVQQQKRGGKVRYIISRIFLPYSVLKFHYSILQKHKWLFPFMEIRRWFKLIFKGGLNRSTNEMKINRTMSAEKQAETAKMMEQLGL